MNEVPMHSQDHTNSEYVSCVGEDRGSAEFIGNKCTNEFPHSLTHSYTDTQLYNTHYYRQVLHRSTQKGQGAKCKKTL